MIFFLPIISNIRVLHPTSLNPKFFNPLYLVIHPVLIFHHLYLQRTLLPIHLILLHRLPRLIHLQDSIVHFKACLFMNLFILFPFETLLLISLLFLLHLLLLLQILLIFLMFSLILYTELTYTFVFYLFLLHIMVKIVILNIYIINL